MSDSDCRTSIAILKRTYSKNSIFFYNCLKDIRGPNLKL